ncbi:RsmB/NOP family class I SAM-dependent RNA methyltransferase [Sphingomonas nostoxanthinifaciens]|uniref:RsmB/NOP family class I SAM-dependent RNA methyltransferase n=1 Tax=Sphingomonas nostoxanthinifaciens TaxID=2872652 RepID=UPI001CC211A9|nr:RsmB/NOP family class I SAM-dependent RNA methyltransferase [Sphingomonas nostoxanthinifaciens]UAK22972.1 RsmB/NOP family class I SAM-dependent RNA methyltransferase [Sphingomonas nostoxanthinifaciens]
MTPAARVQAAIEIVDAVLVAARTGGAAADTLIARYFKVRRFAGSTDRREVRELAYAAIRRAGQPPVSGRAAMIGLAGDRPELADLFDGSRHGPAAIDPAEPVAPAGVAPDWLVGRLTKALPPDEWPALMARAPLDLRVNRLKADREAVLALLPDAVPGLLSPDALRLPEGTAVEATGAFRDGLIEVQDEGSQLIALACAAQPRMTVVDLCAGAGGKTLALAAMMDGEGRLVACDVDRGRLARLWPRAERAGVGRIETRLLDGGRETEALADLAAQADVVLVDAPCSGTGTWRRNPEARWRLSPARLDRLVAMQQHVLELAAPLVRPGGRLVYAVCSLLAEEGRDRISDFLASNPHWSVVSSVAAGHPAGAGRLLTPANDGTDGFFVAALTAPC